MATRYEWRDKLRAIKNAQQADPQQIGECLHQIAAENNNDLKPRMAWKAAQGNPRHILYPHFEWNNAVAGDHWRDQQARELINVIKAIEINEETQEVLYDSFAFLSVQDGGRRTYKPHNVVMTNANVQRRVMRQGYIELQGWMKRYSEIAAVCELVRPALDLLHDMLDEVEKELEDA